MRLTSTKVRTPKVGDLVIFEGLKHRVRLLVGDKIEFASERMVTVEEMNADGTTRKLVKPNFITAGFLADMRWSDELKGWYIWGRVISKGRGGVGIDEREIVTELRDIGLLAARPTRMQGVGPAGGEQLNLYLSLFSDSINWKQELANVRRGEGLSTNAKRAVADYGERFKRKLVDGFAAPDANDSEGEG